MRTCSRHHILSGKKSYATLSECDCVPFYFGVRKLAAVNCAKNFPRLIVRKKPYCVKLNMIISINPCLTTIIVNSHNYIDHRIDLYFTSFASFYFIVFKTVFVINEIYTAIMICEANLNTVTSKPKLNE